MARLPENYVEEPAKELTGNQDNSGWAKRYRDTLHHPLAD